MTDTIIVLQNEREEAGTMILKEKERTTIEDLQTQEKSCIEKYGRYAQQAKDPELKNLFQTLQQKEREHYDSLDCVLRGEVPQCNCNDSDGRDYQPKATYTAMSSPEDKQQDAFLGTADRHYRIIVLRIRNIRRFCRLRGFCRVNTIGWFCPFGDCLLGLDAVHARFHGVGSRDDADETHHREEN